jgi:hypothetical protein
VEAWLPAGNVSYGSMCCISTQHHGESLLVQIGQEKAPWYCGKREIYVGFEFDAAAGAGPYSENPGDRLSDVVLFPWLRDCL